MSGDTKAPFSDCPKKTYALKRIKTNVSASYYGNYLEADGQLRHVQTTVCGKRTGTFREDDVTFSVFNNVRPHGC